MLEESLAPSALSRKKMLGFIGMIIIGSLNNLPYWVAVSSAQIVVKHFDSDGFLGAITWASVLLGVCATIINTFLSQKGFSYVIRSIINGSFMVIGLLLTAFAPNIYVAMVGISITGVSSDFGEGVMLGYFANTSDDSLLNAWGIGTGISGILGSGYSFLTSMFSIPYKVIFLVIAPIGLFYPLTFIFLLKPGTNCSNDIETSRNNVNEIHLNNLEVNLPETNEQDKHHTSNIGADGNPLPFNDVPRLPNDNVIDTDQDNPVNEISLTCCSLGIWKKAIPFFMINGVTFFSQYFTISCLVDCSMTQAEKVSKPYWYSLLNLLYQIGNAVARSTLKFLRVKYIVVMMIVQLCFVVIWIINVKFLFLSPVPQAIIIFLVGFNSGLSYVNIFNQTMNYPEASSKERELITNCVSVSIALFIIISSATTLFFQNVPFKYECIER